MKEHYREILIVDKMSSWSPFELNYNCSVDLVLTYDFALFKHIEKINGQAKFIDSLVDAETMHKNNHIVHEFIRSWYLDADGKDIFVYKSVPFGFSFKMDIWNDLVHYSRLQLCLNRLKDVSFQRMHVISEDPQIFSVLDSLNFKYMSSSSSSNSLIRETYFFPIFKYMDDRIRAKGIRGALYKVREVVSSIFGRITPFIDRFSRRNGNKTVFIQEYHPTKTILSKLRDSRRVNVLLVNFSRGTSLKNNSIERILPIYGKKSKFDYEAKRLLNLLSINKSNNILLSNGNDITNELYKIIEFRVENAIHEKLRILECATHYLDSNRIDLQILIANIGLVPTLLDCVCKVRGIPSYLIINGMLGPEYDDEAKHATVINSYSSNIKDTYFKDMDNIVVLGDPRMDIYHPEINKKILNRENPVIVIGASGFNPVDLNSYLAIEFDFIFDVLSALKIISDDGVAMSIIVKVRPNGYKSQYYAFIQEYFPELSIELVDDQPMINVLKKADYYISIYSQTLFEASCLGVPVLYYRKDNEIMFAPFDNKSELVTATTVDDLIEKFIDYQRFDAIYDAFLDRGVMEKYIGPLDGKNQQRNYNYILKLLGESNVKSN